MLRAGVLALAITASFLDEFDAEAWKAQKDEELKFLLKVRELAHEHARVAAGAQQHEIVGIEQRGQGVECAEGSQRFAQLERRRATASVDQLRELEQRGAARLRGLLERGEDRWEDVEEIVRHQRNGRRGEDSVNVNERAHAAFGARVQ